jgi:phosphoribosylanthranilate isomerase
LRTKPRVKICCIKSADEAATAIDFGAAALGLVSAMPSGPGPIAEELIAQIAVTVPPPIGTFLLTCAITAEDIIAQQRRCRTNTIQLCDYVRPLVHAEIRAALPGISLVQVIHVTGPESVEQAIEASRYVHALLLDSGNPTLAVKELGGTGRRHDWNISRRIRDAAGVPIFLAGGLNPGNVQEAVETVEPFGLDLCTGVRSDDMLDAGKLRAFFDALGY